ncbi:MAG: hypothetical protein EZS28_010100 [Streblomastix strix]|uniref:Uncharacterized protein n=1 Tax=Streblomastix strix TaxID=222440 RepID=A0A5J4WJ32_9EUKA|nr:MAG: hypothetical protein EZS28_010100 [Streblomastix strix]
MESLLGFLNGDIVPKIIFIKRKGPNTDKRQQDNNVKKEKNKDKNQDEIGDEVKKEELNEQTKKEQQKKQQEKQIKEQESNKGRRQKVKKGWGADADLADKQADPETAHLLGVNMKEKNKQIEKNKNIKMTRDIDDAVGIENDEQIKLEQTQQNYTQQDQDNNQQTDYATDQHSSCKQLLFIRVLRVPIAMGQPQKVCVRIQAHLNRYGTSLTPSGQSIRQ